MQIFKVGGSVRDSLLDRPSHDTDYVVVGSTPEEMLSLGYKQVGNDFPVFLHPKTGEEYALARKEISTGKGYQDFKFDFNPNITLQDDLERRDFTINSLAMDEDGNIIDYFNGKHDLENGIIRHINSEHFIEDPLRVLRGIRQCCQLQLYKNFIIGEDTLRLMSKMVKDGMLEHLTPERVWKEIEKALETTYFDLFIHYLDVIDGLKIIFPEIYSLKNVPEKEEYHPEKNAYKHLILTLKQVHNCFFEFPTLMEEQDPHEIALVNFGLLCHDLGKNLTQECWPSHHGHEILGLDLVDELCDRLKVPNEYRDFGKLACKYHMCFYEFLKSHVKNQYDKIKEWTRNFKDNRDTKLLLKLHACDLCGREGQISQERIDRYWDTLHRINKIKDIMWNKTLKDLPEETQKRLFKFKGEKFGSLYRDAMISYLKHNLQV